MKRKALGKGLSALLPDPEPPPPAEEATLHVSPDRLEANPFQPRTLMEPARLEELAASIRESGMIQPLLVRRAGGSYQIIAGERRWRAAQRLGLPTVPVVIRDVPDDRLLELALVENIQREELTPLEEAQAFQRLHDEFRLTQEDVARKVGRDRSTVANTVRLLRLPGEVKDMIAAGRLDAALGREAARKGLSVREVERRVALARAPRPRRSAHRDPNTRAAEERLRAALGTRVQIVRRGKAGTLRVAFATEAELQRIYELLLRAGRGR